MIVSGIPIATIATTQGAPPGVLELVCVSISATADFVERDPRGRGCLERWLNASELEAFDAFVVPKRRRDWLAGRLAAKEAVRGRLRLERADNYCQIEICTSSAGGDFGRPQYLLAGEPGEFSLSISHAGDTAVATLAPLAGEQVGVDIECIQETDASFEAVALSPSERRRVESLRGMARWRAITTIWVIKEAFLKALGVGLRMPLAHLSVDARLWESAGEAASEAPREMAFAIDRRATHLHPLLADLDRVRSVASTFALGEALGAWVTLSAGEDACNL